MGGSRESDLSESESEYSERGRLMGHAGGRGRARSAGRSLKLPRRRSRVGNRLLGRSSGGRKVTGEAARRATVREAGGGLLACPGLIRIGFGGRRISTAASSRPLLGLVEERPTAASRSCLSRWVQVVSCSISTEGDGGTAGLHAMARPAKAVDDALATTGGDSGGREERRC